MEDKNKECKYCSKEDVILRKDVPSVPIDWSPDGIIRQKDVEEREVGILIDERIGSYFLRLVYLDDCNCIDHGEKIEINYCPFCGKNLHENPELIKEK